MKGIISNIIILIILFPAYILAQGAAADPALEPSSTMPDGTTTPVPEAVSATPAVPVTPAAPRPAPVPTPRTSTPTPIAIIDPTQNTPPMETKSGDRDKVIATTLVSVGAAVLLFFGLNAWKKKIDNKENDQNGKKCANIKKLMEDKLNEITDLQGKLADAAKDQAAKQIKNLAQGTRAGALIDTLAKKKEEYEKLKELYEKCITDLKKEEIVFVFHGTEGYPEENWFPWLKGELEGKGHRVFVPQFPTPPVVPAKLSEWFEVLENYKQYIDEDTIIVGHSLGGTFALKLLEQLEHPIKAVFFVGAAIGVKPIFNYDRDKSFSGFDFDWQSIRNKAKYFFVFQSDDDPYVSLGNGEKLAKELGVEMTFIPNAGHFNTKAGYTSFPALLEKVETIL